MRSLLGPLLNRTPIPYTAQRQNNYGTSGWLSRASSTTQMEAMSASATLFTVVNRTSTAAAKQAWHLHESVPGEVCGYGEGTEDECGAVGVRMVEKHPALVVLNKPNSFYTRQELFESGQQHVDLTGEGWLIISWLGRVPYELWLARPDRMVVVTDPRDFLVGYLYCGPDGKEMPLRPRDVLSMRMPNPMDPYRGAGPVQTIMAQISGSAMSAEWNANFYRNGARPGGIVKLATRRMPDAEFEKLVERWNWNHKGVANAGRTAFLEEGDWIDPKPMSVADMQLVETSNLNRDTILLAFGASKYDVGVLEDVNRASASAASNDFAERMTVPRLDRWQGMLNNDFLPLFPGAAEGYEFVYTSPVRRDRAEKRADDMASAQIFKTLIDAGMSSADAAEIAGLPEVTMEPKPDPVVQAPPVPSPDSGEPAPEPVPA